MEPVVRQRRLISNIAFLFLSLSLSRFSPSFAYHDDDGGHNTSCCRYSIGRKETRVFCSCDLFFIENSKRRQAKAFAEADDDFLIFTIFLYIIYGFVQSANVRLQ